MRSGPLFQYVRRSDGRRVAYQVVGAGDLDLVFLLGWPTHLGFMWENPSFAGFQRKLSSFSRLILFDRVGGGLSDRGGGGGLFEDEMDDARAVLAAVGSERAALFGCHSGGRLALLMAATYPDQVSAVVTFGSHPATLRDDDYPWGSTAEEHEGLLTMIRDGETFEVDMLLYMAERIPGARFVELPGEDHFPFFGDQDRVIAETQEFLTGATPVVEPDRVLATVLFSDIVDSTRLAAELGDRRWHRVLVDHQQAVRRQLDRFRGHEIKTTGDGFLATFDGPARAIRAADALRAGLRELDLEVRVGLHTGECELLDEDIGGIAVHIAARVLGRAEAGEILCSRTVKDLVAGSGFSFADRGSHSLKGIPDDWQLYAVELAEG